MQIGLTNPMLKGNSIAFGISRGSSHLPKCWFFLVWTKFEYSDCKTHPNSQIAVALTKYPRHMPSSAVPSIVVPQSIVQ
jgi:hypothetical protein